MFEALAAAFPDRKYYHYMLGLAHKYRRDWAASLRHNLLSIQPGDDDQQGTHWNAAIAATALGDWQSARDQWRLCGLKIESGAEPIDADWGMVCVRLNAWDSGETLFALRTSPAIAVLRNVPLADSGFRYGDEVVVDGASTGQRNYDDGTVPVLNALQRFRQSEFKTYVATVYCADSTAADALVESSEPGIGLIEDWTGSVHVLCRRCSYGTPHSHADQDPDEQDWIRERRFGIASTSRAAVDALLSTWCSPAAKSSFWKLRRSRREQAREVLDLDETDHPLPEPAEGQVWWRAPETGEPDAES